MINRCLVIGVVGGFRDNQKTTPYNTSAINVIFSVSKVVVKLIAIALLEDRRFLYMEDPVAKQLAKT